MAHTKSLTKLDSKTIKRNLEDTSDIIRERTYLAKRPKINQAFFEEMIYRPANGTSLGLCQKNNFLVQYFIFNN